MRGEINFRWNVKGKTLQLLEENMVEYFYILRVRKDFSKHINSAKDMRS